jgi:MFS family permease
MFLATGYADYPLIAYHFKKSGLLTDVWIPILYAIAMLSEGLSALFIGRLFDRLGAIALIGATVLSLFFAPFVFLGNAQWAITGMVLWGIGMGAQGSILKAVVADMVPPEKRATAFGLFDTAFGIAWFAGSAYMGYLYDHSIDNLVIFSMNTQTLSIIGLIIFIRLHKLERKNR